MHNMQATSNTVEFPNNETCLGPTDFWPFCPLLRGCPLLEVKGAGTIRPRNLTTGC